MYWFNILDILEEASEPLTTTQIFHKYLEKFNQANRTRIVGVLKKLVVAEEIIVEEGTLENQRGRVYFYSIKK